MTYIITVHSKCIQTSQSDVKFCGIFCTYHFNCTTIIITIIFRLFLLQFFSSLICMYVCLKKLFLFIAYSEHNLDIK